MTPPRPTPLRRRHRADDGFTLVESVVATTLFGILAATVLTFALGTYALTVQTQRRVTATHLAEQAIAEGRLAVEGGEYTWGGADAADAADTVTEQETTEVGGTRYSVARTATLRGSGGAEVCRSEALADVSAPAVAVDLAVEVTWEGGQSPVRVVQRVAVTEQAFVAVRLHDTGDPVSGVRVALLTGETAAAATERSVRDTDTRGCAVFEVDPADGSTYWYTITTADGQAVSDTPRYVLADWRYGSTLRSLGRVDTAGLWLGTEEVRLEAIVDLVLVDDDWVPLGEEDLADVPVTVLATDGLASATEQVRWTSEAALTPTSGGADEDTWAYPMRSADLAWDDLWWAPAAVRSVDPEAPAVTAQPADKWGVAPFDDVTLEVSATGAEPMEVLWQISRDGGYTFEDLTAGLVDESTMVLSEPGAWYRAVVTNEHGTVVSAMAGVREEAFTDGVTPVVVEQPQDVAVELGAEAGVEVRIAVAEPPPDGTTISWDVSDDGGLTWRPSEAEPEVSIEPGTSAWTLRVAEEMTAELDGLQVRARIGNEAGEVVSHAATVRVQRTVAWQFTLRALWPAGYTFWVGSQPIDLRYVDLAPGERAHVLVHPVDGVVAVQGEDGLPLGDDGVEP